MPISKPAAFPVCPIRAIRSRSTPAARRRCADSLIGAGRFSAHIEIPEAAPFPSHGRLLAFYARYRGQPALF